MEEAVFGALYSSLKAINEALENALIRYLTKKEAKNLRFGTKKISLIWITIFYVSTSYEIIPIRKKKVIFHALIILRPCNIKILGIHPNTLRILKCNFENLLNTL
ncbi:hypothetical protein [Bartonella taylorii]|uniref:hypothetical protein n=1 Tax=Bartonella taylorii TaxID=33046 RepID=UPI001ABA5D16|nr:hypothetical protein [Bartonella taylorii]